MEIILTGTEIHALREALETDILNLERELSRTGGLKVREELKEKVLKSIMEKLPVEFASV